MVCKLKKISDSFELGDDTFFRAVFLYDYYARLLPEYRKTDYKSEKELDEYFEFSDSEEEQARKVKYELFFISL